jgi:hypothetical protein
VGRLAIIARLKSRSEELAADLIAKDAPFDPEESGFDRHAVYLSAMESSSCSRDPKSTRAWTT